jgi:hypothetical protein
MEGRYDLVLQKGVSTHLDSLFVSQNASTKGVIRKGSRS